MEEQRKQLQEQERQVAELRAHIAILEGDNYQSKFTQSNSRQGGHSVDDFSIKNAASRLEKQISRWAAEVVRNPPVTLDELRDAAVDDLEADSEGLPPATELQVQNLLRHALSETVSESIINCLIITNSTDANVQLTRIHEHLFSRDPTVACVWRRQTFSAAVDSCSPEMSQILLKDRLPLLLRLLSIPYGGVPPVLVSILDSAFAFSRMLHGSKTGAGGKLDAFYKAFVPDLGTPLDPLQVELIKRCLKAESGEMDRVGSCIFPGLVKTTGGTGPAGKDPQSQSVMKRALVMCECALGLSDPVLPIRQAQTNGYVSPSLSAGPGPTSPTLSTPTQNTFSGHDMLSPVATLVAHPVPNISQNGRWPVSDQNENMIPNLPNPYPITAAGVAENGDVPVEEMDGLTLVHPRRNA